VVYTLETDEDIVRTLWNVHVKSHQKTEKCDKEVYLYLLMKGVVLRRSRRQG
jgi:hypothetical protein